VAKSAEIKVRISGDADLSGFSKASRAVQDLGDDIDDTRTKAQKIADAINSSTDQIVAQFKEDADAADALAKAIGPEMAATAKGGIADLVTKLKNLGLTSEEIKADAQALGDAFKHSQDAVSDLQKVDSELEDIEQGAKDAKKAIAGIGDADTSGASGGVHGVNDEIDHLSEKSAKAKGATNSLMGGIAGDSVAAQTGIGPLGESISQLAEGALEGEVNFKQLGGAIGTMGAAAAAVWLVNAALDKMEAKDAFHQADVDAFVKSIKAGEDAVDALTKRLTEAGKIEMTGVVNNLNPMSDAVSDVTTKVLNAGLTVQQFSQLAIEGGPAISAWAAAQKDAGTWTENSTATLFALTQTSKDYKDAQEAAKTSTEFFKTTITDTSVQTQQYANSAMHADDVTAELVISQGDAKKAAEDHAAAEQLATQRLDEAKAATQNLIDTQLSAIDAKYADRKATQDAEAAVATYQTVLGDHKSTMQDVASATDRAFDATLNKSVADVNAKGAALDSKAGIDGQIASLQAQADKLAPGGALRQRIDEYIGDLRNIPTQINTALHVSSDGSVSVSFGGKSKVGATGGIVHSRTDNITLGEAGPEAVIPLDQSPGASPLSGLGLGGGGVTNNYYLKLPNGYSDPVAFAKTRTQLTKRGDRSG
jgi:hypothetical protein